MLKALQWKICSAFIVFRVVEKSVDKKNVCGKYKAIKKRDVDKIKKKDDCF